MRVLWRRLDWPHVVGMLAIVGGPDASPLELNPLTFR